MNSKQAHEGKNTESVQQLGNAESTNKQECLIEYKHVKDTPFTIVKTDTEMFGTMGNNKITENYENEEELERELKRVNWNRIMQVLMIMNDKIK